MPQRRVFPLHSANFTSVIAGGNRDDQIFFLASDELCSEDRVQHFFGATMKTKSTPFKCGFGPAIPTCKMDVSISRHAIGGFVRCPQCKNIQLSESHADYSSSTPSPIPSRDAIVREKHILIANHRDRARAVALMTDD